MFTVLHLDFTFSSSIHNSWEQESNIQGSGWALLYLFKAQFDIFITIPIKCITVIQKEQLR